MKIHNVLTRNFPFEEVDGEQQYFLHSAAVVESIAELIPDEIKPSVIIDYDQIPLDYVQKIKTDLGIREVDRKQAALNEKRLLQTLENEKAFEH